MTLGTFWMRRAAVILLAISCAAVLGDDDGKAPPPPQPPQPPAHRGKNFNIAAVVLHRADELNLNLTAEQKTKLDTLSKEPVVSREQAMSIREKVDALLTKDQVDKFHEFLQKEKQMRKEHPNAEDNDDHK